VGPPGGSPARPPRLNTIRLDVMELTEKVDNAIKFLSDMFIMRACMVWRPPKWECQTIDDWWTKSCAQPVSYTGSWWTNSTRPAALCWRLAVVIILIVDLFLPISRQIADLAKSGR